MYKIDYKNGSFTYEKIENYVEPDINELQSYIESAYTTFQTCLMHPRTILVNNKVLDFMRKWCDGIDKSNITSEAIRWYQKPKYQKVPEEEIKRRNEIRTKYGWDTK